MFIVGPMFPLLVRKFGFLLHFRGDHTSFINNLIYLGRFVQNFVQIAHLNVRYSAFNCKMNIYTLTNWDLIVFAS